MQGWGGIGRAPAARAVKLLAAAADAARPRVGGAVVLLYHRVGRGSGISVDLPAALFSAQMEELAAQRRTRTLDELIPVLTGESPPPAVNLVGVTFDDGTADFVDVALPILVENGVPATIYLATEFIERGKAFSHDGTPVSWSAMSDALATGLVTVGSHTHTHALLDRLDPRQVDAELDLSIALIEDRLGVRPAHFSYPKALVGSSTAEGAVRQRFVSAALAGTRPNPYGGTDPHRLKRSPVQTMDGMRWFRRKADGGMSLEDDLRNVWKRREYAGAVT